MGKTITFKLAKESQPVIVLSKVTVCMLVELKVNPFQLKGVSVSQTVVSVVLVKVGLMVTFSVAKESQAEELTKVTEKSLALSIVTPFHINGIWVSHTVVSVVLFDDRFTVKFSVAVESQLFTFKRLKVWLVVVLKSRPFHW